MTAGRRTRIALSLAAAASLALPAAAGARQGGSSQPAPAPAPVPAPAPAPAVDPVLCDYTLDGQVAGGFTFSNQMGDAGCLTALSTWAGTVRLYSVAATPGWTWTSSDTTTGIRVVFTNTATGARAEARIEPGKTDIRL